MRHGVFLKVGDRTFALPISFETAVLYGPLLPERQHRLHPMCPGPTVENHYRFAGRTLSAIGRLVPPLRPCSIRVELSSRRASCADYDLREARSMVCYGVKCDAIFSRLPPPANTSVFRNLADRFFKPMAQIPSRNAVLETDHRRPNEQRP